MNTWMRLVAGVVLASLVAGCVSGGPHGSSSQAASIARCLSRAGMPARAAGQRVPTISEVSAPGAVIGVYPSAAAAQSYLPALEDAAVRVHGVARQVGAVLILTKGSAEPRTVDRCAQAGSG